MTKEEIKETKEETLEGVAYYSKLLQKQFDTLEELRDAEKKYNEEKLALQVKQDEKRTLAKQVEDAYSNYIKVVEETSKEFSKYQRECEEKIRVARDSYTKERNHFIEKYGSYHMTYRSNSNKPVEVSTKLSTFDWINEIFNAFRDFPF